MLVSVRMSSRAAAPPNQDGERSAALDLGADVERAGAGLDHDGRGRVAGELDREVVDLPALRAEGVHHAGARLGRLGERRLARERAVGRRRGRDAARVVAVGVAVERVVAARRDLHGRAGRPAAQLHQGLGADRPDGRRRDQLLRLCRGARRRCGGGGVRRPDSTGRRRHGREREARDEASHASRTSGGPAPALSPSGGCPNDRAPTRHRWSRHRRGSGTACRRCRGSRCRSRAAARDGCATSAGRRSRR